MKRYCKNIDITDRNFISIAVRDCLKKKMTRKDAIRLLCEYSGLAHGAVEKIVINKDTVRFANGLVETVIDGIRQEIIDQKYIVKPIHYKKKSMEIPAKSVRSGYKMSSSRYMIISPCTP